MSYSYAKIQNDLSLNYLEQYSPQLKDQPLIIFLHGYGSNEDDLFDLKQEFDPAYTYLSVRAPMTLDHGSYQWFNKKMTNGTYDGEAKDLKNSEELLEKFITAAVKKYHTSHSKVILMGFSQGAIISYELALQHPNLVKGIAALSGIMLPTVKAGLKSSTELSHLKVFIGHGTIDDRIPVTAASDANTALIKAGVTPELHSYMGMGHSINKDELNDLKKWLSSALK